MADLEKREDREQELMALLLVVFASETMPFWTVENVGSEEIYERMQEVGVDKVLQSTSVDQSDAFFQEIEWSKPKVNAQDMMDALIKKADHRAQEIADRMAKRLEDWKVKRSIALQLGEESPSIDSIYTETQAEREAITSLTQIVSDSEMMSRDYLWVNHDVIIQSFWTLDRHSNWCKQCMSLAGLNESEWRMIWDGVPPRHPNCRCSISHSQVYHHVPRYRPVFTERDEPVFVSS